MKKILYTISLVLAIQMVSAQSASPFLRIETGMHNSIGRRLSSDAAGKFLLSCSDDKTARLWDASNGKLLQLFRIPIGEGREGRLYSCALSADGKLAAVAGQTAFEWSNTYCIYLLSTQTGEIIQRLESLPAIINDLEFSPDGKYLAAGFGKTSGVKIFQVSDWKEIRSLDGFGAAVYNIAFSKECKMAVACFDGKLRLYNKYLTLQKELAGLPGQRLISVAFDPSGKMISCGYHDSPAVELRSAEDLSILNLPSLKDAEKEAGGLEFQAFSKDGSILWGAGRLASKNEGQWKWVIRRWSDGGKGDGKDLAIMKNAISDIKSLPNGNLAIISTFPDLAVLDKEGKLKWYHSATGIDFTAADASRLRVNKYGSQVSFNSSAGKDLLFDVADRKLKEDSLKTPGPLDSVAGMIVKDWSLSLAPAINGSKVTFFSENERAYSTDITEDGKNIVLGTSFSIYLVNSRAEKLWKTSVPATAVALNITDNEKAVVATLSDGTIRWYSLSDGKELLAFYLDREKERWILFSPSGYFDASPGAEDLLGWHLNNGPAAQPSFYPVSRFRDKYFRPDIIDAVFETYQESQAISLANQRKGIKEDPLAATSGPKPLPTVYITSPANGTEVSGNIVSVKYSLNFPSTAPARSLKVLVNGRPVNNTRGVKTLSEGLQSIDVNIPSADCVITLLAENDNGTSPETNIYLKWKAPDKNAEELAKPTLYVLSIGISKYDKEQYRLQYAAKDAGDFAAALGKQKGSYYKNVVVRRLVDGEANKVNILDGLQWIQENTGRNDVAMIFFAGHGLNDNNGIYYMLPVDADAERLRSTCINFEEIKQTQSTIEGKVIVFIDACHSGNIMGGTGNYINSMINLLTSTVKGAGAITFTSSTGKEVSYEDSSWGNGAFTKALIEGLNGAAAVEDEAEISYTGLSLYISRRVKKLTDNRQHPTLVPTPNTPDFVIAAKK